MSAREPAVRSGRAPDPLIRALQRGGMAVEDNNRWAVFRQRDRRRAVVGYLDAVQIDALRLTGALTPFGEDATTLIWSGPAGHSGSLRDGSALRRPDPKASARRRKPIEQVLDALNNDRDRLRARNAGLRLTSDIQRAMSPQSVTMRWDAAGAVDGSRKADRGGGSISAAAAKRQLDAVAAAVGDQAFSAVIGLLVHGRPLTRIAGDCGLDRPSSRQGDCERLAGGCACIRFWSLSVICGFQNAVERKPFCTPGPTPLGVVQPIALAASRCMRSSIEASPFDR